MKWLLVLYTNNADPSREEEFNEWYETHLPDVLETPGFVRATRYVNIDPNPNAEYPRWGVGPSKFMATYEIESDDINKTMAGLKENAAKWRKQGLISELLVFVSMATYRQISSLTS